jgi:hypothetical protein
MATARSAVEPPSVVTVVVTVALSFVASGSGSAPVTVTVLVKGPGAVGMTPRVIVAEAPGARVPRLQVTVPAVAAQLPWLEAGGVKVTPADRGSLSVTLVAGEGPLLVTVTA